MDKKIDGALLTFIDVDLLKKSMEQLRRSLDYAESIVNTVRGPLLVLDPDLNVVRAEQCLLPDLPCPAGGHRGPPLPRAGRTRVERSQAPYDPR